MTFAAYVREDPSLIRWLPPAVLPVVDDAGIVFNPAKVTGALRQLLHFQALDA